MDDLDAIVRRYLPAGAAYATATVEGVAGGEAVSVRLESSGGAARAWCVSLAGARAPWPDPGRAGGDRSAASWPLGEFAAAARARGLAPARLVGAALRMEPGARVPWREVRAAAASEGALSLGDGRFRGSLGRAVAPGGRPARIVVTLRQPRPRVDEARPAERASYDLGEWADFYAALTGREPEVRTLDCGPWLPATDGALPPSRPPPLPWRGDAAGRAARRDPLARVALPAAGEGRGPEGLEALDPGELAARVSLDFGPGSVLRLEAEGGAAIGVFEALPGGGLLHHADPGPLLRAPPYTLARLAAPGEPWASWAARLPGGRPVPRVFYAWRVAQVLPQGDAGDWDGPHDLVAEPGRSLSSAQVARHFAGWPRVYLWLEDGRAVGGRASGGRFALDGGPTRARVVAARASPSGGPTLARPRRHVAVPAPGGRRWRVLDRALGALSARDFGDPESAWLEADLANAGGAA